MQTPCTHVPRKEAVNEPACMLLVNLPKQPTFVSITTFYPRGCMWRPGPARKTEDFRPRRLRRFSKVGIERLEVDAQRAVGGRQRSGQDKRRCSENVARLVVFEVSRWGLASANTGLFWTPFLAIMFFFLQSWLFHAYLPPKRYLLSETAVDGPVLYVSSVFPSTH